jgi:hypothetical protein
MRKVIVACLAFAFLPSPLPAEETKPGGSFAGGLTKGAGEGGGSKGTVQDTGLPDRMKSANKGSDQIRSLLLKPQAKPVTSKSEPEKNKQ